MDEDLKYIRLPDMHDVENKKIIVFGTGTVGRITLEKIQENYGENKVSFFLNSTPDSDFFMGIPVIKPEQLTANDKKNHLFILATLSKPQSLKRILLEKHVDEKLIYSYPSYYNFDALANAKGRIHRVCICPPVKDQNKLKELIWTIQYYGLPDERQDVEVDVYTEFHPKIESSHLKIKQGEIEKLESYDLVFVWKNEYLYDAALTKCKKVFGIDGQFYENADINMLLLLSYKTLPEELYTKYQKRSIENFLRLKKKTQLKKALIVGNGESLEKGIGKYSNLIRNEMITYVCNSMINNKEKMAALNPAVYILYDTLHLRPEMMDTMNRIIQYVIKQNCFLIVPEKWLALVNSHYQMLEEKIIGMKNDGEQGYHFPSEVDLTLYTKPDNVVTRYMIPIASAFSKEVFFMGCDGAPDMDISNYRHISDKTGDYVKYTKLSPKAVIDLLDNDTKCMEQHVLCFEELINYGISHGIRYQSLTDSYIPILHELYHLQ